MTERPTALGARPSVVPGSGRGLAGSATGRSAPREAITDSSTLAKLLT